MWNENTVNLTDLEGYRFLLLLLLVGISTVVLVVLLRNYGPFIETCVINTALLELIYKVGAARLANPGPDYS